MSALEKWAIWLVLTAGAVAISYFWIDRPIALFFNSRTQGINLFERLTLIPNLVTPLVLAVFVLVAVSGLSGRAMSSLQTVAVLAAASLAVGEIIKDHLKYVFGRTWPETWVRNNPSFVQNGSYGFHPFHGGQGYASFPSGHTTAICAVMSVLWICYPRLRPLYGICIAAIAIGLVAADFHFLSDVIAGAFLGTTTGWLTVVVWGIGDHKVRPPKSDA